MEIIKERFANYKMTYYKMTYYKQNKQEVEEA